MWERFSFYSVSGMLSLYLTKHFHWLKDDATSLVAWYTALVYASPLIGGWLADRYLGYKKSIYIGGVFFIIGHAIFAVDSINATYLALGFLILGNGLFKPNVSTMVGNLYPTASKLKDRAFSIFYVGINVGATLGPATCELLQQNYGFHRAFNAAAVGMAFAMVIFYIFGKHVPETRQAVAAIDTIKTERHPVEDVPELHRVIALSLVCAVGVIFWMVFWQNNTTLTYWADENTDWSLSGIISNAINPAFVVLLGFPVNSIFKYLDRRGLEPSTPAKMTLGLFCASLSTTILYFAAISGGDTGKVSPLWLISAYAMISIGEILLSAMGLSLVSKVAPPRFRGLLMGGWFLSIAVGGKLSVIGVYWTKWSHSAFFAVLTGISLAATVVLFLMLRFLRKSMPGV